MLTAEDPIHAFEPLWGSYYADALIGQGSYGKVYHIIREESGRRYESALKHISIPNSETELQEASHMGMDENALRSFWAAKADQIIKEISIIYSLRGEDNVVTYEDHLILHREGSMRWDILIRMELLIPLLDWIANNPLDEREVLRLGIELCAALKACARYNIIHRDIKEGNVFLNSKGVFKLGDFGIARELYAGTAGMSMRGTPSYIAPEVYCGKSYNVTADIYSLGILLYKLLNDGRYPFFPPAPQMLSLDDAETAFAKRMKGDTPPPPRHGGAYLKDAVMMAIDFNPQERFQSAEAFQNALRLCC